MIAGLCKSTLEIIKKTVDIELIVDCHYLKAVSFFRLGKPIDAVESFN
jgi:hypothetical protein